MPDMLLNSCFSLRTSVHTAAADSSICEGLQDDHGKRHHQKVGSSTGTFATPVAHPFTGYLTALAIGDCNGDAKPDLAASGVATVNVSLYYACNEHIPSRAYLCPNASAGVRAFIGWLESSMQS
jgi:hypothetical protein